MKLFGWGRYRTGSYPTTGGLAGGIAALQNRSVAGATQLVAPFTPAADNIAAIAFTPRLSGIVQISANVIIENGTDAERYSLAMAVLPGTDLTVTGGATTVDGWVIGSTVPPVIGGTPDAPIFGVEDITESLASGAASVLSVFGISPVALPLDIPGVIAVAVGQIGGGHALSDIAILNLTVMELP